MEYLGTLKVSHRDLKLENVFVEELGHWPRVFLADFGFSKAMSTMAVTTTMVGSACMHGEALLILRSPFRSLTTVFTAYMAPEVLRAGKMTAYSTRPADVWAWAVMAVEIVTGQLQYAGKQPRTVM